MSDRAGAELESVTSISLISTMLMPRAYTNAWVAGAELEKAELEKWNWK